MKVVSWDSELEHFAQSYAGRCPSGHRSNTNRVSLEMPLLEKTYTGVGLQHLSTSKHSTLPRLSKHGIMRSNFTHPTKSSHSTSVWKLGTTLKLFGLTLIELDVVSPFVMTVQLLPTPTLFTSFVTTGIFSYIF